MVGEVGLPTQDDECTPSSRRGRTRSGGRTPFIASASDTCLPLLWRNEIGVVGVETLLCERSSVRIGEISFTALPSHQ